MSAEEGEGSGSYETETGASESGESEESVAEEPRLKYQRLGNSVTEVLNRDAASCLVVHNKFLALGTHWGVVYILDFNGNEIKRFSGHTATVNELSVDNDGEYIASCSDDGKVFVNGLWTEGEALEYIYHRPVKAVALDPLYQRTDHRQFCTGGLAGKLQLNSKGWFGKTKNDSLHAGEGPIHAVKWRGALIAWANDAGIKMYDCESKQRITYIDRPKGAPRADMYRCHLVWQSDDTILIGWADWVKIGVIREKPKSDVAPGMPTREVVISALFQTEYYISGLAPFKGDIVIMAYVEADAEEEQPTVTGVLTAGAARPELRIVTKTNEELSSDALSIHGWQHYHCNDYRLAYAEEEELFYILSPKDIVVARPRDLDDHVTWLMDHQQFEEALAAAEAGKADLKVHKIEAIGERMLDHFIKQGEIERAAHLCPDVLKHDKERWERWVFNFFQLGPKHVAHIIPLIPTRDPQLGPTVYEMVLTWFLQHDNAGLLRKIREWPSDLYKVENVIQLVRDRFKEANGPTDLTLMDVLAELYTSQKNFDKALQIYLKLKRGDVFALIRNYNLYATVQDKVIALMDFDGDRAVEMLIDHTDRIPVRAVVAQLNKADTRHHLHKYLHALFAKDQHLGEEFHGVQVALYADYDPNLLLPFLRQSTKYDVDVALGECQQRKLYPAMVYLLGRMGNSKEALMLIIEKLQDVAQAIEFAQQCNDEELWEDLISKSIRNPKFVGGLLDNIGGRVDPIKLISRIPKGLEIPHLRDRLVKIISDYNLQMSLREGCREILKSDCVELQEKLVARQRCATSASGEAKCATCGGPVAASRDERPVAFFFCGHCFHDSCIRAGQPPAPKGAQRRLFCTICRTESGGGAARDRERPAKAARD